MMVNNLKGITLSLLVFVYCLFMIFVEGCWKNEREALLSFEKDLVFPNGTSFHFFRHGNNTDDEDCCKWSPYVHCNKDGHIISFWMAEYETQREWLRIGEWSLEQLMIRDINSVRNSSLQQLRYLEGLTLSGVYFGGARLPEWIGSFTKLRHLDLSRCNFSGPLPVGLANLVHLEWLDLYENILQGGIPDWIGSFTQLSFLDLANCSFSGRLPLGLFSLVRLEKLYLSDNKLEGPVPEAFRNMTILNFINLSGNLFQGGIPDWIGSFTQLRFLYLSYCNFSGSLPVGLFNLVHLERLDLSYNKLEGPIPDAFGNMTVLESINLRGNLFQGGIPASLGNLVHLESLDLNSNTLQGGIPASLGKLCFVSVIDLSSNCLSGDLKDLFRNLSSGCTRSSLSSLDLSTNQITGTIPDTVITFSSLDFLSLGYNKLNGTISPNIGLMYHLREINLTGNSLSGVLNETHFTNLTTLESLDLSNNALTLNCSSTWSPKFRADFISLRSCNLGPHFPTWLQSQLGSLRLLDISAAGISDTIPDWFFNSSYWMDSVSYLNMSYNKIQGHLPRELGPAYPETFFYASFDFRSNLLEGSVPTVLKNINVIVLSDNCLSGEISSSICETQDSDIKILDLSHNWLSGEVPNHCFTQYKRLQVLNLANNNFSGRIPGSIWNLPSLKMLNLRENYFSGDLQPTPNFTPTKLEFLDLSHNRLSGSILSWIGQQSPALMFLNLRANQFIGNIPAEFCRLKNLRILSLAMNKLWGTLPSCLDKITAMTYKQNLTATLKQEIDRTDPKEVFDSFTPIDDYIDNAVLMWQGKEQHYSNILGYLILIDVSNNRLSGEIPTGIVQLSELVALNLSRNHFYGRIPGDFGKLNNIQVVDLSRNQISGHIPSSISQLTFLSLLDLSYNNLSGKIPSSTQILGFDPLRFAGNPALCGPPLKFRCQGDDDDDPLPNRTHVGEHEEDEFHDQYWFYVGSATGFVTGFWIICGTLLLKHSWRHAYFHLLDEVAHKASVAFIKLKARLQQ